MTGRLRRRHLLGGTLGLGAAVLAPGPLSAQPAPLPVSARDGIPGDAPRYTDRALSAVPNEAAMPRRFWAPGLNEAYVPQGLTVLGEEILVAAGIDPRERGEKLSVEQFAALAAARPAAPAP